METLKGKILRVFSQKGDWSCIQFEKNETGDKFIASGKIGGVICDGIEIQIEGDFVNVPKYGRQFKIATGFALESATVTFLYKCVNGIGPALAAEIVKQLGEDCIDKIKEDPNVLLGIKGIKKKKHQTIMDSLVKNKYIQLYIDVFNFFNNDVTYAQADKIVEVCLKEKKGFEKIKENPYWLISNVDGFGFKRVDKMAMASGIGEFSLERIAAAIIYTLKDVSRTQGHVYSKMNELIFEVVNLMVQKPESVTKKDFNFILELLINADDAADEYIESHKHSKELEEYATSFDHIIELMGEALVIDAEEGSIVIEDEKIYTKKLYETECSLASFISEMVKKKPVKKVYNSIIDTVIMEIEKEEDIEYAPEQKEAVKNGLRNRLSVITGGPGRGKTTILKIIMECWNDDDSVILLAPTGKAAKRMEEATDHPAKTVLRYQSELKAFKRNSTNLPKNSLIIFDEASMAGVESAELLFWMSKDCNLIIVGDVDQLESIEPGTFLADIISCGVVPVTELKHGYRNDGAIAYNGRMINAGKGPSSYMYDDSFQFIEAEKEGIPELVTDLYMKLIKDYAPCDIGIISPIRKTGYGSVNSLNQAIRNIYNPETKLNPNNSSGFRIYDRVMNVVNDYSRVTCNESMEEAMGVFNGDCGSVDSIDLEDETVTILFDDFRKATYKFSELQDYLTLSYVISDHKSQGSQWKALIVVVSSEHSFFLHRKLLYTAETRAKLVEYMIGSKKTAALAARKNESANRNSNLKNRVIDLI